VDSKTEVNEERLDAEMEAMQQMMEDNQDWIFNNKWDFMGIKGIREGECCHVSISDVNSYSLISISVVMCQLVTSYTLTL
jgi:hypothetical protein